MKINIMKKESSGDGIGFLGLLMILFIGLKLGHIIDWSWWWVLSPILIPVGLVCLALFCFGAITLFLHIKKKL